MTAGRFRAQPLDVASELSPMNASASFLRGSPPAQQADQFIRGGILSAVGSTPLVRFDRVLRPRAWSLYGKLEALNPGGSTKDRAALWAIEDALSKGSINPDTLVVESSSGNMGIGLSQVCCYYGLRFICVVDPCTTAQNIRLMEAYGTHVEMVRERDEATQSYLPNRLRRVQSILMNVPNAFWVNQYENSACVAAHEQTTAAGIVAQLGRFPDFFVCSVGTCATLQGCAQYFRQHRAPTRIVAVDSLGSVILGGEPGPRKLPGVGSAQPSRFLERELLDIAISIPEEAAIRWCKQLARSEAVLLGGSSGMVLAALEQLQEQFAAGSTVVALLPDRGERYLDLIYDGERS